MKILSSSKLPKTDINPEWNGVLKIHEVWEGEMDSFYENKHPIKKPELFHLLSTPFMSMQNFNSIASSTYRTRNKFKNAIKIS